LNQDPSSVVDYIAA
jgi:hypothetical protein